MGVPVQAEILKILEQKGRDVSISELIQEVQRSSETREAQVKAAVLPLISRRRVEFTPGRKLRIRHG